MESTINNIYTESDIDKYHRAKKFEQLLDFDIVEYERMLHEGKFGREKRKRLFYNGCCKKKRFN